eukprot:GHVH01004767.1.p1 GENE.GHVH01004767.1~~GHVH01004767.1.p1  ORF type:complete len:562 (+),score=97.31 GHVH01004767.1:92-1777(+)
MLTKIHEKYPYFTDEYPKVELATGHFDVVCPEGDPSDDEFFLVRGTMDLSLYMVKGFESNKRTDYRICDFTQNLRKDRDAPSVTVAPEDAFLEVDNTRMQSNTGGGAVPRKSAAKIRFERSNAKTRADRNRAAPDVVVAQKKVSSAPMSRYEKQKLKQRKQDRTQNWGINRPKILYEWSVTPDPHWGNLREINLNELARAELDSSKIQVEEICNRGVIPFFDKSFEKITPKTSRPLKRFNGVHHNAGFMEDSTLQEYLDDESVQVIATDEVITQMMSACLTRYSWHLTVTKADGKIIFDKDEGTMVENMTVRETSRTNNPVTDDPVIINRPKELHEEATQLQLNVCQMVLGPNAKEFEAPDFNVSKPIHANQGRKLYKYRKFEIPPTYSSKSSANIKIVTRVEVDAIRMVDGKPHYTIIKAMNEYDNKGGSYRQQLDKQPGALSAAEYRNNSPKVARWLSQAMLSGADTLVLAWVTREHPHSNKQHQLIGVITEKMDLLQNQLGLKPNNVWGILRSMIDPFLDDSLPDGEYVLLREPNKPIVRIMYTGNGIDEYSEEEDSS